MKLNFALNSKIFAGVILLSQIASAGLSTMSMRDHVNAVTSRVQQLAHSNDAFLQALTHFQFPKHAIVRRNILGQEIQGLFYVKESDLYPGGRSDHALLFRGEPPTTLAGVAPIVPHLISSPLFCTGRCTFAAASELLRQIFIPITNSIIRTCEIPSGNYDEDRRMWNVNSSLDSTRTCDADEVPANRESLGLLAIAGSHLSEATTFALRNQTSTETFDPFVSFSTDPGVAIYFMSGYMQGHQHGRLIVMSIPESELLESNSCRLTWLKNPGQVMEFQACGAITGENEFDYVFAIDPDQIKEVINVVF